MDLIKELLEFLDELKQYKRALTNLDSIEPVTKKRSFLESYLPKKSNEILREELREKLIRKSGAYSSEIIKLTSRQYFTKGGVKYDRWVAAFNPLMQVQNTALTFCIDAVNEAIGKLQKQQEEESEKLIQNILIDLEKPQKATQQQKNKQETFPALFDAMQFHPKVVEASKSCFVAGNYREAILDVCIALEDHIKEITGLDLKGDDLMNNVFSFSYDKEQKKITKFPIIRINELKNETNRNEQQGFMFLCKGATAFMRNTKAHKLTPQPNPLHALEYLAFTSLLFRRIDEAMTNLKKESHLDHQTI